MVDKIEVEIEVTSLQDEHKGLQNEIELKNDQIYDFKNQISLVKERETHYLHQINVLQSSEGFEVNKLNERIKQLEQECLNLKKQSDLELLKQDDEINQLQHELELLSVESNQSSNTSDNADIGNNKVCDENLLFDKEIQILSDEILEKQLYLEQLQKQNLQLSEPVKNSQLELDQLNENISYKKQNLTETNDLISTLEEEMFSLKHEVDTLKLKYQKYNDSENSLFAEVNDKRLKLQEILLDLTQKCDKMKLEIANKQRQISALRLHNDELTNIVKNDQAEYKLGQNILIETYNSRINTLKNLSEKYQNIIVEIQQLSGIGLPNNIVEFLNNLIEEKKKNEEKLNEEIGMQFRMKKMISLQLKEAYLKLQEWKEKTEHLKQKYLEHNETIQKLKQKENTCSLGSYKCNISQQKKENDLFMESNENDENLQPDIDTKEAVSKIINEKKVTFSEDTKTLSTNRLVRRGGRVIQSKSIHIPSLTKKK